MQALPLLKLGILAVKTLAKPIAARLKSTAKTTPMLSRTCFHIGQKWHNIVSRVNIRLLGHKIKVIKPLGEAEAVSAGADFVGESFIYCVSAGAVIFEVRRNDMEKDRKAREKTERQKAKEWRFQETSRQIDARISALSAETAELKLFVKELQESNEKAAKSRWSWYT